MSDLFLLGANDPEMAAIERLLIKHGKRYAFATIGGVSVTQENAYKATGYVFPEDVLGEYVLGQEDCPITHRVECGWHGWEFTGITNVDHHNPGDPGFGRLPESFLPASSLGQVYQILAKKGELLVDRSFAPLEQEEISQLIREGLSRVKYTKDTPAKKFWRAGTFVLANDGQVKRWVLFATNGWAWMPDKDVLIAAMDHCPDAAKEGKCPGSRKGRVVTTRPFFYGENNDSISAVLHRADGPR